MTSIKQAKALIRNSLLDRRDRLSVEKQTGFSKKITWRLLETPEVVAVRDIALYWSHRGEVLTSEIFTELKKRVKNVYLPRLNPSTAGVDFARIEETTQLRKGYSGIYEPDPGLAEAPLAQIELMVIPGVAFDKSGRRIGWGQGHYDRVLKNFSGSRIALAYDFQVLDNIPSDAHDEPVHMIVTERRRVNCRGS